MVLPKEFIQVHRVAFRCTLRFAVFILLHLWLALTLTSSEMLAKPNPTTESQLMAKPRLSESQQTEAQQTNSRRTESQRPPRVRKAAQVAKAGHAAKPWFLKFGSPHSDCIRSIAATKDDAVFFAGVEVKASSERNPFIGLVNKKGQLLWSKKTSFDDTISFPQVVSANIRSGQDSRDSRDSRDIRDSRDSRDSRDGRDSRESRDSRDGQKRQDDKDDDGSALVLVSRARSLWLAKLTREGEVSWQRKYKTIGFLRAPRACLLADGLLIATQAIVGNERNIGIFKINFSGEVKWAKQVDMAGSQHSPDIALVSDGGCIVSASNIPGTSFFGRLLKTVGRKIGSSTLRRYGQEVHNDEALIFRLSSDGHVVWQKRLYHRDHCTLLAVSVSSLDTILASGVTISKAGRSIETAPLAILLSSKGELLWQRYIASRYEGAATSALALDGCFAIGGFTRTGGYGTGGFVTGSYGIDMWYCWLDKRGHLLEYYRIGTKGEESQAYLAAGPNKTLFVGGGCEGGVDKKTDALLCQIGKGQQIAGLSIEEKTSCEVEQCLLEPSHFTLIDLPVFECLTNAKLTNFSEMTAKSIKQKTQ